MLLCSDSRMRQAGDDPGGAAGFAYRFESRPLNRLLGRGGRMADSPDPSRYATLFRRLRSEYGGQLRYGFMLPVNLLLSGVVARPIYHERRVPQLAPMAMFVRQGRFWSVRAVISVMSAGDPSMADRLIGLYADFGVKLLVLTPELVDSDYVDGEEFARQVKNALFPACDNQPLTPAQSVA
jgi:hypothetical protein